MSNIGEREQPSAYKFFLGCLSYLIEINLRDFHVIYIDCNDGINILNEIDISLKMELTYGYRDASFFSHVDCLYRFLVSFSLSNVAVFVFVFGRALDVLLVD
jgi:hypothetical protein